MMTDAEIRIWAVELVQKHQQELAIGSISMGLQVADVFAQYVLLGTVPDADIYDEDDDVQPDLET